MSAAPAARARIVCAHCGSVNLRRSAPKGDAEKQRRRDEDVHFHRCLDCGARGERTGDWLGTTQGVGDTGPARELAAIRAIRVARELNGRSLIIAVVVGLLIVLIAIVLVSDATPPS
jgi:hypothetical protein